MSETAAVVPGRKNPYRVVWGAQRFPLSIGWKTLIAFFIVLSVPLTGITFLVQRVLEDTAQRHVQDTLGMSVHGALAAHAGRLDTLSALLSHTAALQMTKDALAERRSAPLRELLQQHAFNLAYVDAWLVTDPKGNVIARRNNNAGDQVMLNAVLPQVVNLGQSSISNEIIPRDVFLLESPERYLRLERMVMTSVVAVPVMKEGAAIGVLVGIVLLDGYDWLPNLIHDGAGEEVRLFGALIQDSRVVASSRRPGNLWVDGWSLPVEVNDPLMKGKPFSGQATISNEPCFILAEPLFNTQKHVIGSLVGSSRTSAVASFVHTRMLLLYGFIVAGSLLSLLIAFFAHRDTLYPIRALVRAMDDFAAGRPGVRTEIVTKDEFEDLGKGFNRMADAICGQQARVEKYNSLAKLLITTLNPKELLKNALDKVLELTDSKLGIIYLMDEQGETLQPFVTHAVDLDALKPLRLNEGLAGSAAAERQSKVLEHLPETSYIHIDLGFAVAAPTAVAAFPLIYKDKVLGVMLLGTFGAYQAEEQPLIEYLANQIAITLDNALTNEKVERLSIADGLTNLYNRRFLNERLKDEYSKALRYQMPLSFLILDIDFFKRVNDTYGHQVGDNALVAVAHVLQQSVRDSDLVARYGGEEFAVLLPHTGLDNALAVAEKIRLAVSEISVEGMGEQHLTISIGASGIPDATVHSIDELVRRADEALYRAKETGRNRVVSAG